MSKPGMRWISGLITLFSTILLGSTVAAADVRVLPGDTELALAPASQTNPDIARGGNGYLTVWQDLRSSPFDGPPFATEGRGFDIYARRLDATGTAVDSEPFVIATTFGDQTAPKVAWNGENWLVAWARPNATQWDMRIEALRIAPDGTVLDTSPIVVQTTQSQAKFELTANGSEWFAVLQGTGAGETDLRGVRISAAGAVINSGGTRLVASTSLLTFDVASAQGEYLLLWGNSAVLPQGQRFSAALSPIGAPFPTNGIEVASNGTEYFVAWIVDDPYWDDFVEGQRLGIDGLPGPILTLAGNGGALPLSNPNLVAVDADGGDWWVSWLEIDRGVVFSRVAPGDAVLDFGGVAVAPAAPSRAMQDIALAGAASGGAQFVWQDNRSGGASPGDIVTAAVAANALPGLENPVSVSAHAQLKPDMAMGVSEILTVFLSESSDSQRLLGQRLGGGGAPIDLAPFEIASGPGIDAPRVAFDGTRYLVVWSQNDRILGKRVRPDGSVIDSMPLSIMDGRSPDVAGRSGVFLVVGTQPTISVHFYHPFSMRVDGGTGGNLDLQPVILGQYFARNPRVAAFPDRWLATWQRNFSHDDLNANLMAAFVSADGTTSGEFLYGLYGGTPAVAASASSALFVWRSSTLATSNNDILGRTILVDGTLSATTLVISDAADSQRNPAVAWNGTSFVVAWEDKRNARTDFDERAEVVIARVSEAGAVEDPLGFAFGDVASPEILPEVVGIGGLTLIAASSFRDDPGVQSYRVVHEFLGDGNARPVALATASPASGEVPVTVSFSGTQSYDPDGSIVGYDWDFGDGSFGSGATLSHDYVAVGDYLATLTVTDNQGATGSATLSVSVHPVNQPPVAIASASPTTGAAPLAVTFESTGSYDPDDGIASIVWDFGDGSTPYYGATAYHSYDLAGIYTATLTVTDRSGASAVDTVQIDVAPQMFPPVAVAAANPQSGVAPLAVSFDSGGSSDPDGMIVAWRWNFGDGMLSNEANPAHVYQVGGRFLATLTVTDNDGASSSDSILIDVLDGDITGVASADFKTQWGYITEGSYLDTAIADGVYEALTERVTKGKVERRRSGLSHAWTFDVEPGPYQTFYVRAHHTPNGENDDFIFEYTLDGKSFAPMVMVSATAPGGGLQSYAFTQPVSGRIYIRVSDTDRSYGNAAADTLYVDEMFIVTSWQASGF